MSACAAKCFGGLHFDGKSMLSTEHEIGYWAQGDWASLYCCADCPLVADCRHDWEVHRVSPAKAAELKKRVEELVKAAFARRGLPVPQDISYKLLLWPPAPKRESAVGPRWAWARR